MWHSCVFVLLYFWHFFLYLTDYFNPSSHLESSSSPKNVPCAHQKPRPVPVSYLWSFLQGHYCPSSAQIDTDQQQSVPQWPEHSALALRSEKMVCDPVENEYKKFSEVDQRWSTTGNLLHLFSNLPYTSTYVFHNTLNPRLNTLEQFYSPIPATMLDKRHWQRDRRQSWR